MLFRMMSRYRKMHKIAGMIQTKTRRILMSNFGIIVCKLSDRVIASKGPFVKIESAGSKARAFSRMIMGIVYSGSPKEYPFHDSVQSSGILGEARAPPTTTPIISRIPEIANEEYITTYCIFRLVFRFSSVRISGSTRWKADASMIAGVAMKMR